MGDQVHGLAERAQPLAPHRILLRPPERPQRASEQECHQHKGQRGQRQPQRKPRRETAARGTEEGLRVGERQQGEFRVVHGRARHHLLPSAELDLERERVGGAVSGRAPHGSDVERQVEGRDEPAVPRDESNQRSRPPVEEKGPGVDAAEQGPGESAGAKDGRHDIEDRRAGRPLRGHHLHGPAPLQLVE